MSQMLSMAIKLLADRSCSERNLRRSLEKEFVSLPDLEPQIDACIERLRALHLLNDNRFADSIAHRYSHKGNRFIEQTLKQKGVPEESIASALENLDDEYSRALDEARKKGRRKADTSVNEAKTSMVRFLSGRGFYHDTIKALMRDLADEGFFYVE